MGVLMPVVFIGVGVVCGAVCLVAWRKMRAFLARAQRVPGVVVGLRRAYSGGGPNSNRGGTVYRPVFRFQTYDGRDVQVESSVGANPPTARPGERVEVLYDPANPQKARLDKFTERGGLVVLVMGILTSVFTLVGVILAIALNA